MKVSYPLYYQVVELLTLNEDQAEGISYNFNASHRGDDIIWEVLESNASPALWDINNSTGVFRYLPEGNFSGKHSFALSAISGTESVERFFNVLVQPQNDSPIFLNDLIPDVFTFSRGYL